MPKSSSSGTLGTTPKTQEDTLASNLSLKSDVGDSESWIPQVPFDTVLNVILPKIHTEIDVDATVRALFKTRHLSNNGWAAFRRRFPGQPQELESHTLQPLAKVYRQIRKCMVLKSGSKLLPTLQYQVCINRTPFSIGDNSSQPDGIWKLEDATISTSLLKGKTSSDDWLDIAVCETYSNSDVNQDYNTQKILQSMEHVIHNDPRRRFTFGVTINDTQTRVWVCCHQGVLVSKPFDFMKDYKNFVQLVLSLSFASVVDLGWDPTMTLRWNRQKEDWEYDITIVDTTNGNCTGKVYRTSRILHEYTADALYGPGTRVFEARIVDLRGEEVGNPVAIKDFWLDADRVSETLILADVLKDASSEEKKYFLTACAYGNVLVDGRIDHTEELILGGLKIGLRHLPLETNATKQFTKFYWKSGRKQKEYSDFPFRRSADVPNGRQSHPRRHHRVVFEEIGYPLFEVKSMKQLLSALIDTIKGLEFMHKRGYIHGDISPGNVLIVNGVAKLSDLEYSRKYCIGGLHNVRTGTVDFMSIEVENQHYCYVNQISWASEQEWDIPKTPFIHNPLHDLESVWWMGTWGASWKTVLTEGAVLQSQEELDAQWTVAMKLFPQALDSQSRLLAFTVPAVYANLAMKFPQPCMQLARHLDGFRSHLLDGFKTAEAKLPGGHINTSVFKNIHSVLLKPLEAALVFFTQDVELCSLYEARRTFYMKREATSGTTIAPPSKRTKRNTD